jgi:hypothetical protein
VVDFERVAVTAFGGGEYARRRRGRRWHFRRRRLVTRAMKSTVSDAASEKPLDVFSFFPKRVFFLFRSPSRPALAFVPKQLPAFRHVSLRSPIELFDSVHIAGIQSLPPIVLKLSHLFPRVERLSPPAFPLSLLLAKEAQISTTRRRRRGRVRVRAKEKSASFQHLSSSSSSSSSTGCSVNTTSLSSLRATLATGVSSLVAARERSADIHHQKKKKRTTKPSSSSSRTSTSTREGKERVFSASLFFFFFFFFYRLLGKYHFAFFPSSPLPRRVPSSPLNEEAFFKSPLLLLLLLLVVNA